MLDEELELPEPDSPKLPLCVEEPVAPDCPELERLEELPLPDIVESEEESLLDCEVPDGVLPVVSLSLVLAERSLLDIDPPGADPPVMPLLVPVAPPLLLPAFPWA